MGNQEKEASMICNHCKEAYPLKTYQVIIIEGPPSGDELKDKLLNKEMKLCNLCFINLINRTKAFID